MVKPLASVKASWLIGLAPASAMWYPRDRYRVEIADRVRHEVLLHVAHHAQRELGREDAGVLRLVLLEDVCLHRAAHPRQRLGPQPRVLGLFEHPGRDQRAAVQSQQRQPRAIVALGQLALVHGNAAACPHAAARAALRRRPSAPRPAGRSTRWSIAVFMNIARSIGAGR